MDYLDNIGKKVTKCRHGGTEPKKTNAKPFKSKLMVNTVRGVINHPHLNVPAYTFKEDDSYVECARCVVVDVSVVWWLKLWRKIFA
jgi:hypothetical protein